MWSDQRSLLSRTEERDVVRPQESDAANRGAEPAVCWPTEESAVLRTDNVAAPNRNLADLVDLVENWSVFDEN